MLREGPRIVALFAHPVEIPGPGAVGTLVRVCKQRDRGRGTCPARVVWLQPKVRLHAGVATQFDGLHEQSARDFKTPAEQLWAPGGFQLIKRRA